METFDIPGEVPRIRSRFRTSFPFMPPPEGEQARRFAVHVQPHEWMLRAWRANRFGSRLAIRDVIPEANVSVLRVHTEGELHAPKAFLFATARNLALDSSSPSRPFP